MVENVYKTIRQLKMRELAASCKDLQPKERYVNTKQINPAPVHCKMQPRGAGSYSPMLGVVFDRTPVVHMIPD